MPIRRASVADIATLVELERTFPTDRLSARSFRRFIAGGTADVWVYAHAGTVLGDAVVLYRRDTRIARLYSLVVAPRARGKGIGSALVVRAERLAARRGCVELQLEVRPDNKAARALYLGRGYADRGTRPAFYEDGGPALRLGKPLRRGQRPAQAARAPRTSSR